MHSCVNKAHMECIIGLLLKGLSCFGCGLWDDWGIFVIPVSDAVLMIAKCILRVPINQAAP